jgi:hypothetical protein
MRKDEVYIAHTWKIHAKKLLLGKLERRSHFEERCFG